MHRTSWIQSPPSARRQKAQLYIIDPRQAVEDRLGDNPSLNAVLVETFVSVQEIHLHWSSRKDLSVDEERLALAFGILGHLLNFFGLTGGAMQPFLKLTPLERCTFRNWEIWIANEAA